MISHARLAAARAKVASAHTDRFAVYRATGAKEIDPVTYEQVDELATVYAEIRGKVQTGNAQTADVELPAQQVAETGLTFHTAYDHTGILTNDIVVCLACRDDPDMVGARMRVTAPFTKSHATARRFQVKRIS